MSEELEQAGRKLAELESSPVFKVLATLQANGSSVSGASQPQPTPIPPPIHIPAPAPVPVVRVRSALPSTELPALQKDLIPYLLKRGPMTRDELFSTMEGLGRAPGDVGQLSALLSRFKAAGVLTNNGGSWSLATAATTQESP